MCGLKTGCQEQHCCSTGGGCSPRRGPQQLLLCKWVSLTSSSLLLKGNKTLLQIGIQGGKTADSAAAAGCSANCHLLGRGVATVQACRPGKRSTRVPTCKTEMVVAQQNSPAWTTAGERFERHSNQGCAGCPPQNATPAAQPPHIISLCQSEAKFALLALTRGRCSGYRLLFRTIADGHTLVKQVTLTV